MELPVCVPVPGGRLFAAVPFSFWIIEYSLPEDILRSMVYLVSVPLILSWKSSGAAWFPLRLFFLYGFDWE